MTDNLVLQYFDKGGWIMWPILITSLVAVTVIFERLIWWTMAARQRDPVKLDKVYSLVKQGDLKVASGMARTSEDPILRVIWHALNNFYASPEGALHVAAELEVERASRFIIVLDTIVTLAPLLGLIGTVTGLMRAFFKLGNTELSETAISGGIAEALIATVCGLAIAVVSLVFLNYFSGRVAKLQLEIQNACTNMEGLFGSLNKSSLNKRESLDETPISAAA
jgi:biopolymer transport protein ExbB